MKDCRAALSRTARRADKATPHLYQDGVYATALSLESDLTAATGGVNCSARSMALWMNFLLNNGVAGNGKPLLSPEQVAELFKQATLNAPRGYMTEHAGAFLSVYALGWNVSIFYGQPIYAHSGGLWGMTSYIALMPEQGLATLPCAKTKTGSCGSSPAAANCWAVRWSTSSSIRLLPAGKTAASTRMPMAQLPWTRKVVYRAHPHESGVTRHRLFL